MTMQIKRNQTIAGVSMVDIREFFLYVRRRNRLDFDPAELQQELNVDARAANFLLKELEELNFIQHIDETHKSQWELTDKGTSLSQASAAGKVHRTTADAALQGVLRRVIEINSRPDALDDVAAVVVFGSFLKGAEKVGDLDLAVKLRDRYPRDDQWSTRVLGYANKSGRSFSNFVERLSWHEMEIYKVLKAGKRTISIQPWSTFLGMPKEDDFKYEVVFGDPEEIRADCSKAASN